ncbi:MAG: serine/threonine protein kinase [Pirellula sp.]|jgi:serine/threonine-protein kinase
MTQITSDRVHELIEKSKLVDAEAFTKCLEEIRASNGGVLPEDPVELCKGFETAGLLTRWQCEKILQGKYKGFFLGNHKLLGHIGSGGMSSVYLAEHMVMKHKRAIKVLPKSKLGKSSYLERFQREAKAIASLNHHNIVRAYDIDNEKDTHYLVMEYVEGADLQILVKKHGPLPFHMVADFMAQSARGLQHAHDEGLIHRDVKPANLLVNKEGVIKVLDLGLALFQDQGDGSLTMEYNDKVLGTADYLAPEQALNSHNVDNRADIYGLGCTMYFLLTGQPPFPDGSIASRIIKHQTTMPPDIRKARPDCPGELDGICVKMMQKDPRYRYTSCTQVAEVLETWLAKYRVDHPDIVTKPTEGMSVDDLLEESKSRSNALTETVNNKGAETMGGKVGGSAIVALSASDSGVLRAIAKSDGSSIDSHIDLIHDNNLPNSKKSKSQSIQRTNSDFQPNTSGSSPLIRPMEPSARAKSSSGSGVGASGSGLSGTSTSQGKPTSAIKKSAPTDATARASTPAASSKSKPAAQSGVPWLLVFAILITLALLGAIAYAAYLGMTSAPPA